MKSNKRKYNTRLFQQGGLLPSYQEAGILPEGDNNKVKDWFIKQFEGLDFKSQLKKLNQLMPLIKSIPGGEDFLKRQAYRIANQDAGPFRDIRQLKDTSIVGDFKGNYNRSNRDLNKLAIFGDETGFERIPEDIRNRSTIPLSDKELEESYKDIPAYWIDATIGIPGHNKQISPLTDSIPYKEILNTTKSLINRNRYKRKLPQFKEPYLTQRADSILFSVSPGNSIIYSSGVTGDTRVQSPYMIQDGVASYSARIRRDPATGGLWYDVNDIWDWDSGYADRWASDQYKEIGAEQAKALNSVSKPFYLMGSNPIAKKKQQGGIINDNRGYWNKNNWGKPVKINSNNITMKGVPFPVLGTSQSTGESILMQPGKDYTFKKGPVVEVPVMQNGGKSEESIQLIPKGEVTPYIEDIIKNQAIKYEDFPDLFKTVDPSKYKKVTDYFNNYYKSPFTKKKAMGYFGGTEEDKENSANRLLKDALYGLTGINNTKVIQPNNNRTEDILKIDPDELISKGRAIAYKIGNKIMLAQDMDPILFPEIIAHEFGHDTGYVGEVGGKNYPDNKTDHLSLMLSGLADRMIRNKYNFKGKGPSYINSGMGEWKAFMDELRYLYKLPVDKPITKDDLEQMKNNPRFHEMQYHLSDDDIVDAFNTIVDIGEYKDVPVAQNETVKSDKWFGQYGGQLKKYQEGGNTKNPMPEIEYYDKNGNYVAPNTQDLKDWLSAWYNNRIPLLRKAKNIKPALKRMNDASVIKRQMIEKIGVGIYNPMLNTITIDKDYDNPSTIIHELTHAIPSSKLEKYGILEDILNKEKLPGPKSWDDKYFLDSTDEMRSLLNQIRFNYKLNPVKRYTIDELEEIGVTKGRLKSMLTPKGIERLVNEIAENKQNNNNNMNLNYPMSSYGGSLYATGGQMKRATNSQFHPTYMDGVPMYGFGSWLGKNPGNLLQVAGGIGAMFVPGMQGVGMGLISGGASGMIGQAMRDKHQKATEAQERADAEREFMLNQYNDSQKLFNFGGFKAYEPGGFLNGLSFYNDGGELDNITHFPVGGTHQQNPHGGIRLGNKALVEEGEYIWKSPKHGEYVFSNRY